MAQPNNSTRRLSSQASTILLLVLTTLFLHFSAQAAAPVGQTIWIRAAATNLFVSADQNRGTFAPLVADRSTVDAWEQFQVVDAGSGFIAFKTIGTGLFVSADQARAAYAPLVADRSAIGSWEQFTWTDIAGGAFTLKGRALNRFVSADLNRGSFAPLVCDRTTAGGWEQFTWGAVGSQPPAGAPPGFSRLVWSDEFNSTTINTANWGYDLGNSGFGNNELENYTSRPENARIENGMLIIEARRESLGGSAYTSARLKTQGKQSFGINTWVEARINAPEGQGIWPAFWMLGNSISTVGWPSCGEIDIMEMQGQNPFQNFGTIHWADANGQHASFGGTFNSSTSLAAGFHTFAVSRTASTITWYVDRVQYAQANIAGGINSTSEFQGSFFILLNVAVGGNFVGSPDGTTVFPQQMQVDWVRVWGT
ncbi:MAG TPA: glycoside hydrolase family 16 protein [Pyrinomonadaceae bacterium]|nr:glycoside hydrolase family 16 protein [Pyrinomonadaceae bacterium]